MCSMYGRYAVRKGFSFEVDLAEAGHVVMRVIGKNCEAAFQHEPGKHVVQRVPETERNGRRQTSIVSVAVLPLPPMVESGLLPERELDIKFQCSGGPGGQKINKTASAVRMKHIPTGQHVFICNERNQIKNKQIAHRILSAKVRNCQSQATANDYNNRRREQLGGGNRGDKVRTYNFIESRVVDHRLESKTSNIKNIMKGELDLLFGKA